MQFIHDEELDAISIEETDRAALLRALILLSSIALMGILMLAAMLRAL